MNPVVISQKRVLDSWQRQVTKERDLGLSLCEGDYATQRVFRRLGNAARVKKAKTGMELVWIKACDEKKSKSTDSRWPNWTAKRGSSIQGEARRYRGEQRPQVTLPLRQDLEIRRKERWHLCDGGTASRISPDLSKLFGRNQYNYVTAARARTGGQRLEKGHGKDNVMLWGYSARGAAVPNDEFG